MVLLCVGMFSLEGPPTSQSGCPSKFHLLLFAMEIPSSNLQIRWSICKLTTERHWHMPENPWSRVSSGGKTGQ